MITHEYREHHIGKKPDAIMRIWESVSTNNLWTLILLIITVVGSFYKLNSMIEQNEAIDTMEHRQFSQRLDRVEQVFFKPQVKGVSTSSATLIDKNYN